MLPRLSAVLAGALAMLMAASVGEAQGVSLSRAGSGARAAGMADAFVAVADDGTAASWNPAGLGQLRQPEFSFVYSVSDRGTTLTGLRSDDNHFTYSFRNPLDSTSASVEFASAALPFSIARKPVTFQVSWRRLYQLTNAFGGDIERFAAPDLTNVVSSMVLEDRLDGTIDVLSVAAAIKLTSRTSIGGSIDFWRGDWKSRTTLIENPTGSGSTVFATTAGLAEMRGTTGSLGLLFTYPAWNAGLVYHAPFWSTFFNSGSVASSFAPPDRGEFTARFRLPRSIGAGAAWRPAPRWTAGAAVTHDQWTDALVDHVPGLAGPINFFDELPPDISSTRDTVSLNLGVEHLFVHEALVIPLRLGVGWEPQGQMDATTRDPVDYVLFSAGTGYNTNRFKLDAAVQLRRASALTSLDLIVPASSPEAMPRDTLARGASHEWRLKFSAIYRLQDTEKLRGILRKIFG
jgi:long-subunit fatty acid transport protein